MLILPFLVKAFQDASFDQCAITYILGRGRDVRSAQTARESKFRTSGSGRRFLSSFQPKHLRLYASDQINGHEFNAMINMPFYFSYGHTLNLHIVAMRQTFGRF
ncbi:hypothetical protein [uncultured Sutterella sp.]|uniref:hypothetical protein n=1 Tax=uncultured Sutterella sp. TaxID=286133 RepID=UPI0025F06EEA|nr:hypothetical protein [uncultured Sutterella sp.]